MSYDLSSPSERVETRQTGRSDELPANVDELSHQLFRELENLSSGVGADGTLLIGGEVEDSLRTMGKQLYRQLLPDNLRKVFDQSPRLDDLSLLVETDEPWFPWEMLHTYGDEGDFFCLRFRMGQWLSPVSAKGRLPKKVFDVCRFLAIDAGNATSAGPGSRPALDGTAAEVEVLRKLDETMPTLTEIPLDAPRYDEVLRKLKAGGFQWLHFSGHGEFPEDKSADLASLVLEERNLHARDLVDGIEKSMASERPFVVLNACRSSRQGPAFVGLGGWPSALIDTCGCGGLLAPRWAVRDRQASEIAGLFYAHATSGSSLGEAIRQARSGASPTESQPRPRRLSATALSYVYFGHPNARVRWGTRSRPDDAASTDGTGKPGRADPVEESVLRLPELDQPASREIRDPGVRAPRPPTSLTWSPRLRRQLTLALPVSLAVLPVLLVSLGAMAHRSRETMLRISSQSYSPTELFTTGLQTFGDACIHGLTALASSRFELQASAWGLLGLAVCCLMATRIRRRLRLAASLAMLSTVVVLGLSILLYTFALRARHPGDRPGETAALCSTDFPGRSGGPATLPEQLVWESCRWLSQPTPTHEAWRQDLSGLMPFFLLASASALWCGVRLGRQWGRSRRAVLLGGHLVVLLLIVRQVPLAHAYGHWGLEYPTVAIGSECQHTLRESIRSGACCAYDVSAGAQQTVLLVRGVRCPSGETGEHLWDESACPLVRGPTRAVTQGCGG